MLLSYFRPKKLFRTIAREERVGAKEWKVWRSGWEKGRAGMEDKVNGQQEKDEAEEKRQDKGGPVHDPAKWCTAVHQVLNISGNIYLSQTEVHKIKPPKFKQVLLAL